MFWPVLLTLLVADCTTKELAETYLAPEATPHQVWGNVVRLTLAHNPGAAMGLWGRPCWCSLCGATGRARKVLPDRR